MKMKRTRQKIFTVLFLLVLTCMISGCDKIIPDSSAPQAKLSLEEAEEQLAAKLDLFESRHPLDLCRPTAADQLIEYPGFPEFLQFSNTGFLREGISLGNLQINDDRGDVELPVYGSDETAVSWVKDQVLGKELAESVVCAYAGDEFAREPDESEIRFFDELAQYESDHPGSVRVSWNRIQIYPEEAAVEPEIILAVSDPDAKDICWVPILGGTDGETKKWLFDQFDAAKSCIDPEGWKVYERIAWKDLAAGSDLKRDSYRENDLAEPILWEAETGQKPKMGAVIGWNCRNQTQNTVFREWQIDLECKIEDEWYVIPPMPYSENDINYVISGSLELEPYDPVMPGAEEHYLLHLAHYPCLCPGEYRVVQRFYTEPKKRGDMIGVIIPFVIDNME